MYILFDVGGTKTRVGYSHDGETCEEPVVIETPANFEEGMVLLAETARKASGGERIKAVGVGAASPLDGEKTKMVNSPNLSGWTNKPLKDRLSEFLNAPVFIENDTALVGLGEALHGAGRGSDIVVYMTISTGVGGVRIVDGKFDRNRFGFEPGHQIIDMSSTVCADCTPCPACKDVVDLESMISGSGTERRLGKKAYEVPQENELWNELANWLSVGVANTIMHWSPDTVVLGGSMMVGDPAIPMDKVQENLKKWLQIFPIHPKIKKAELGDFGGLYGSLEYVKQKLS